MDTVYNTHIDKEPDFSIHEYEYMHYFNDKIYHATVDSDLTSKTLEIANECVHDCKSNLAGDLEKETLLFSKTVDKIKGVDYLGDLMPNIINMLASHLQKITSYSVTEIDLQNMWANYQSPGDFNPLHDHQGHFSFVWYLDIPEEIRTEHLNVDNNTPVRGLIQFVSNISNEHITFNPKTNDILIFRSNHLHQVYPFYSQNTRISISGNIFVN